MLDDSTLFRKKALWKLVGLLFVAAVLVAGSMLPVVGGLGLVAKAQSDKFLTTSCNLQETAPPQKTTLYANDGTTVLATLFTQDRQPVPLTQVPKYLTQALVATEDRRFYSHNGVDMRGLIRSAFSTGSGDTQGGSTLTMQYVKQVRYYQAVTTSDATPAEQAAAAAAQQAAISQTIDRKIEDANCALYLENVKHESKDTILDNYLNIAFFGENSYGIEVAAQRYFGKDVSKLTLPESAMLVGALQAPSSYDPYDHPSAAKTRRNVVIQNLVEVGDITQAAADKYKAEPIVLTNTEPAPVQSDCGSAVIAGSAFFCSYVEGWLSEVSQTLSTHELLTGGLKIITTLDPKLQNASQAELTKLMPPSATSATAIMPVIDPKTGNVLAMVTNKPWGLAAGQSENALFTQASAAGASTYKYFTALAALKTGIPNNLVLSAPSPYTQSACPQDPVKISNDSPSIPTTLSMSDAFARSSNTYFVAVEDKIFGRCDLTPIVKTALDLGMDALNSAANDGTKNSVATSAISGRQATFTIGSAATSPLQLASAYATVANDGTYCPPSPVLSITDVDGNSLQIKRGACVQKLAPQVARNAIAMMTTETKAPGTSAVAFKDYYSAGGSLIAGKTGTQAAIHPNENQDSAVWYAGVTPNLAATIGIYDPNNPNSPLVGVPGAADGQATGTTAAQIWSDILTPSLAGQSWSWPSANVMSGGVPVPSVVGLTEAAATAKLAAAGFKLQDYGASYSDPGLTCASAATPGTIGYQAPSTVAPAGATITVCPSSGVKPYTAPSPAPTPRGTPASTPTPAVPAGG